MYKSFDELHAEHGVVPLSSVSVTYSRIGLPEPYGTLE